MSFFTAKYGAKAAHALSPAMLKKCFAVLLLCVGSFFLVKDFYSLEVMLDGANLVQLNQH